MPFDVTKCYKSCLIRMENLQRSGSKHWSKQLDCNRSSGSRVRAIIVWGDATNMSRPHDHDGFVSSLYVLPQEDGSVDGEPTIDQDKGLRRLQRQHTHSQASSQ